MNIIMNDKDTILQVLLRDSNYQKLDETYHFDNNGKQLKYILVSSCDSCFQKFLAIGLKQNRWKKLNDTTYYAGKRMLNVHQSIHSFEVVQYKQIEQTDKMSFLKIMEKGE